MSDKGPATRTCGKCGAVLAGEPGAPCPRCTAALAFGGSESSPTAVSAKTGEESTELESRDDRSLENLRRPPGPEAAPFAPGRMVGDYELLEEIDRGGMGVVFKARQRSLKRLVALKMITGGGLGAPNALERFRTEAEAAARLQHPSIVAIYEVGEVNQQPFLSMELVAGLSLAKQIDNFSENAKAAAKLMATVARAVHHAHQHGVIHRDLKPGNILMDQQGQPHITDFGLAKILGSDSDLTIPGTVMGTPKYMSPEQAAGNVKDATTASDIFSLGAIFYHLLTGQPPFQATTRDEVLRQVKQDDPRRPTLIKLRLARDLETICLNCLEKEMSRRYGSAEALAEDLDRWLRREPILARPTTPWERAAKWSRRHPAISALLAVVFLLLVTVAVGATVAAVRINHEATRSRQVAHFLKDMLQGVDPTKARGRDNTTLLEVLSKTAANIGTQLRGQPEVEAELRNVIGEVYTALAEYPKAEAMHREALATVSRAGINEHVEIAEAWEGLANILYFQGNPKASEDMQRKALAMRKKVLGPRHRDVAISLSNLGFQLWAQGRPGEAEGLYTEARGIYEELLAESPADADLLEKEAGLFANLGEVYQAEGKLEQAEATLRAALQKFPKPGGKEGPDEAASMNSLALVLRDEKKLAEAEKTALEALAIRRRVLGNDHPGVVISLKSLASIQQLQSKLDETEASVTNAVMILRKASPVDETMLQQTLNDLGDVLRKERKFSEAHAVLSEAVSIGRALLTNSPAPLTGGRDGEESDLAESLEGLAAVFADQGLQSEAEPLLGELRELRARISPAKTNGVPESRK